MCLIISFAITFYSAKVKSRFFLFVEAIAVAVEAVDVSAASTSLVEPERDVQFRAVFMLLECFRRRSLDVWA